MPSPETEIVKKKKRKDTPARHSKGFLIRKKIYGWYFRVVVVSLWLLSKRAPSPVDAGVIVAVYVIILSLALCSALTLQVFVAPRG